MELRPVLTSGEYLDISNISSASTDWLSVVIKKTLPILNIRPYLALGTGNDLPLLAHAHDIRIFFGCDILNKPSPIEALYLTLYLGLF